MTVVIAHTSLHIRMQNAHAARYTASDADQANGADEKKDVGLIPTAEAAELLGVSIPTIIRRAKELGGRQARGGRGKWMFDPARLLKTAGAGHVKKGAQIAQEGARAAAVFAMLDEGAQLGKIVTTLREAPEFVKRTRVEWLECQRLDREGMAYACSCGVPSNPNTARCDRCHARSAVLTDAQRASLAGQHLPDGVTTCTGCGQQHPVPDLDRLCLGCRSRIGVVIEGKRAHVVLRTHRGPVVLHALSADEMRAVAGLGVPGTPMAATIVVPMAPAAEPARRPVVDEIRTMQAQLDEITDGMAKARAELENDS